MGGHVAHMTVMRYAYKISVEKLKGGLKRRSEYNIKMILKVGYEDMDWIHLAAQNRTQWRALVNKVMNL
jgi:hypothetical protein